MLKKIFGFLVEAVCLSIAILVGFGVFYFLSPYAAMERGYAGAVGGELVAAVAVGVVVFHALGGIADYFFERWDE